MIEEKYCGDHKMVVRHTNGKCNLCTNREKALTRRRLRDISGKSQTAGSVPALLIAVARAAHSLCDDCCQEGEEFKIDEASLMQLEEALNALDELPEHGPMICATGPAKAEAILQSDYDRMNWLQDQQSGVSYNVATQGWAVDFEESRYFQNPREAIDAAMKELNATDDLQENGE